MVVSAGAVSFITHWKLMEARGGGEEDAHTVTHAHQSYTRLGKWGGWARQALGQELFCVFFSLLAVASLSACVSDTL